MSRRTLCCLLAAALLAVAPAAAQDKPEMKEAEKKDHEDLRELKAAIEKAVNGKDIDAVLKHVHPNVVAVWQDGTTSRGHKGVREYYDKHLGGSNSTLKDYQISVEVTELTILYGGNTGISYGTMKSKFTFRDGRTVEVDGPYSATLVKDDGRWVIASSHASVGLFDSPLAGEMKRMLYIGCGIAAVVGLVLGAGVMWLLKRKKAA